MATRARLCASKFLLPSAAGPRNFLTSDVGNWIVLPQSGNTFFTGWDFFTGSDPTNGVVQYVDQATAVRVIPAFVTSAHCLTGLPVLSVAI